jgi:hypothetical protein
MSDTITLSARSDRTSANLGRAPRPRSRTGIRGADALLVTPFFIFGGFIFPVVVEGFRSLFARRIRLGLVHVLAIFVAGYVLLNWYLVRPEHLMFQESTHDFIRWQLREVVPIVAVLFTVGSRSETRVNRYAGALLVVGAGLGFLAALEYLEVLVTGAHASFLHLVRFDPSGYYLFAAWLRAHNAAGGMYAALAALSLWWFFAGRIRFWVLGGNLLALGLTLSRSGYLGFLVIAALYFVYSGRMSRRRLFTRAIVMAVALAVVIGPLFQRFTEVFSRSDFSRVSRFEVWSMAWHDFVSSPIWGVGWGNFAPTPGGHAHNSYLQVLAELGLVGFVLLGAWLLSLIHGLWKAGRFDILGAVGSIMVSALLDHNFGSPTVTAPIFLLAGMAITSVRNRPPPVSPSAVPPRRSLEAAR